MQDNFAFAANDNVAGRNLLECFFGHCRRVRAAQHKRRGRELALNQARQLGDLLQFPAEERHPNKVWIKVTDILKELNKIVPFQDDYTHLEGNSAAHIKSTVVGCSCTVLVERSRLALGTWQGVYFCEFDGPRSRQVWVSCR